MKKLLSVILALTLILSAVPAWAENPLDAFTTEELQTQAAQIQAEIIKRAGTGFELYPGKYIVGEDFPAGKYRVEVIKSFGVVEIYQPDGDLYLSEFLNLTDPADNAVLGKITLEDGMSVVIESTSFRFVPYTGIMNK